MIAAPIQSKPAMPFPNATGRGVKIAVIDSGINVDHPHIFAKTSGMLVDSEKACYLDRNTAAWNDELGHGTAVAAAIQEKAPDAEYYALKLFSKSLGATSRNLIRAIEWAIHLQVDLINLSLGTQNFEYTSEFERLIKLARAADITIICAHSESARPILPGMLDGVLSVDVDWRLSRHQFRLQQAAGRSYVAASGFPRPLPGISPVRNLSGISFAVANMTGLVARACQITGERSLAEIKSALAVEALHWQE